MGKLIISEWLTLDGILDADRMNQWFMPFDSEERREYIVHTMLACDAMLLGRKTYEMLAAYWAPLSNNEEGIADKINSVPKYVVSSTLEKAGWNNSTIIKDNAVEQITRLQQQPGKQILIVGSASLVQLLMEANLIDEYRFLVHPVIAGGGKCFYKEGMITTGLKLARTQTLDKGVILLCYQAR